MWYAYAKRAQGLFGRSRSSGIGVCIDAEAKTAGGIIIIPDTAKEKPQKGRVVAIGPGGRDEAGKLIPIDVKVGDRVLFGKWSGTEVKIDGVEYLIMKERKRATSWGS